MLNTTCPSNGILYCNQKRTQDLNNRIFSRMDPYFKQPPRFENRSTSTKYMVMPVLSSNNECKETNVKNGLNVDLETVLHNRHFALQRSELNEYVPSSTSTLYNEYIPYMNKTSNPHPYLNNMGIIQSFNPNKHNLGKQVFHNSTRSQLLNIR